MFEFALGFTFIQIFDLSIVSLNLDSQFLASEFDD